MNRLKLYTRWCADSRVEVAETTIKALPADQSLHREITDSNSARMDSAACPLIKMPARKICSALASTTVTEELSDDSTIGRKPRILVPFMQKADSTLTCIKRSKNGGRTSENSNSQYEERSQRTDRKSGAEKRVNLFLSSFFCQFLGKLRIADPRTIYRYIEEGLVYAVKVVGKTYRVCGDCLLKTESKENKK